MTAVPSGQLIYRPESRQIKLVFATGNPPQAFFLIDPHDRSAAARVGHVSQTVPSATAVSGPALGDDSDVSSFVADCERNVAAGSSSPFQA
jgi:hypothetical protein